MGYDVIVIGAGISGLTAAALLAKRGLKVGVVEKAYNPGGSCGTFKRDGVVFDQGSAMLYGFGEKGFNPHRFVFNALEEPIDVISHDLLYCVNYKGDRIMFWPDVDRFAEELGRYFPSEKENLKRFYSDLYRMYHDVMVEFPVFTTPDENDGKASLQGLLKHPASHLRFLGFMNKTTKSLLDRYFTDPELFKFFDKLTSTYCYTSVEETPAILSAVMFVDNHVGGSFYPAGSTVFLPGTLEKVIEENGGRMLMEREVERILFREGKPCGVELIGGECVAADDIVYSGTVWNLYDKLIGVEYLTAERIKWARDQVPTYPSVVLYTYVDRGVISEDTLPIEMLVGNPDKLDESEVTVYLLSIDDRTVCPDDGHVVTAIGPSLKDWEDADESDYLRMKEEERTRLIGVLERRFPGFSSAIRHSEVATPRTIERYTNKNGGSVAGPKQMLGQHMFHRLHTRSEWDSLFCCGESTVMGTGTPTVTISGLSAANAILKKRGIEGFAYTPDMENYVTIVDKPFTLDDLYARLPENRREVTREANRCQCCEHPTCMSGTTLDVRGIMRRVFVGNLFGARRLVEEFLDGDVDADREIEVARGRCILNVRSGAPVEIPSVVEYLTGLDGDV